MMTLILTSPEVFTQILKDINALLKLAGESHTHKKHRNRSSQPIVFQVIHKLFMTLKALFDNVSNRSEYLNNKCFYSLLL